MSRFRFIIESLWYYRKQHIAVFLTTIVSTAVLTGALIVGDSVKYSLTNLVDKRLGNIEYALVSGDRFVSSQLASKIAKDVNIATASVLMMQGIAINYQNQKRINKAQIIGTDNSFWSLSNINIPELNIGEAIISQNTAKKLNLKLDDEILLRIKNVDVIPLNAPFTNIEDNNVALKLKIVGLSDDNKLGRFSFRSNQNSPYNIFVNQDFLAEKLELKDLSNIIVAGKSENINENELNNSLKNCWTLIDAGLQVNQLEKNGTFELISNRIFIDKPISSSISDIGTSSEEILTYFVNSINKSDKETPYSFITAASDSFLGEPLSKNDIIINSWLANDLNANIGDTLKVKYFVIGPLRTLAEETRQFTVKRIISSDDLLADQDLMPTFPGLTDAGNCKDWETGIPIDLKKIRDKDEKYWDDFKGTPKAFISLEKGLEIWDNRFGNYTAVRYSGNITKDELEKEILSEISPTDINLSFRDVRTEGTIAASNGIDFGELFLSLSFFVMAAAILLTILTYSLNTESRMSEAGVLIALGFSKKTIISLRFFESVIPIIISSVIGGFLGILYNKSIISGLNSIWNEAVHADMLDIYVKPGTVVIGILIGVIISLLSIYIVTKAKLKRTTISVIKDITIGIRKGKIIFLYILSIIGLAGSIGIVIYSILNVSDISSSLTLSAGFLFMVGCIALLVIILIPRTDGIITLKNNTGISQLAIKNARRNIVRSIAVIALLAIGTFTIIITGANRLTFSGTESQRESGTGGYSFWVENTVPLLHNLNTGEGKQQYGLEDEPVLDNVNFVQFHNLPGDDASCLNLNQVQSPQILGIPSNKFDSLNAFSFSSLYSNYSSPWLELNKDYGSGVIPAFADQTVIQWGLLKSVGDTLLYTNESGQKIKLLLIGGLSSSVFQGNILISDSAFIANFPSSSGSEIMLVDIQGDNSKEVENLLTNQLVDYGVDISSASERLAGFYSVTNTYLTIFMILGGLGVILGTIGLGIVLMRNMIERKHEIALLGALGFKKSQIFSLILTENIFLLISGIVIGVLSAFIGILPSLLSPAFHIPGSFLFILVLCVFISGLLWIYIPAKVMMKKDLIKYLSQE